jgi:hypothetical protein
VVVRAKDWRKRKISRRSILENVQENVLKHLQGLLVVYVGLTGGDISRPLAMVDNRSYFQAHLMV